MASLNDSSIEKVSDNNQQPRLEETCTPHDHSELFTEVDEDNIERVKKFLVDNPNGWREVKDKYGATLLHRAAGGNNSKRCLEHIVEEHGNSVSIEDKRGCQPLHYAAYNGQAHAVKFLLSKHADINARNKEGETPLLVVCLSGNIQTIGLLLDKHYTKSPTELPPTDGAYNTVLHMIMSGNGSMLKELLKEMKYTTEQLQELVKARNKAGQTILHMAALQCQLPTIQHYLSELKLTVDAGVKDNRGYTCEDYAKRHKQMPFILDTQNEDGSQNSDSTQASYRHKSPDPLLLAPPVQSKKYVRNNSTESRGSGVTPATDGVIPLGDPVKRSIIKRAILQKDHSVEVHVLTIEELKTFEDRSLALDRSKDTTVPLELLCGLHGNVLNKLPSHCHLVSPLVMVKSDANRPLLMRITIPHALELEAAKIHPSDIKVFAVNATGVLAMVEAEVYKLEPRNCTITMAIDKQRIFAVTVKGKLTMHTKLLPSISLTQHHGPPAIRCICYVLAEPNNHGISVKVYCAIDLPISWKLLSDINKEEPLACEVFTLSHKHIDISYQCIKLGTGWAVSNSPHKMESSSILPSPQGERFFYPPSWEFKVSPRQDVRSDKVTCKLLISTGKTVLVNRLFDHDLPTQYYSRQSTPNAANLSSFTGQARQPTPNSVDPSSLNHQDERFECNLPMQQCDTINLESMESNAQGPHVSNGHSVTVKNHDYKTSEC